MHAAVKRADSSLYPCRRRERRGGGSRGYPEPQYADDMHYDAGRRRPASEECVVSIASLRRPLPATLSAAAARAASSSLFLVLTLPSPPNSPRQRYDAYDAPRQQPDAYGRAVQHTRQYQHDEPAPAQARAPSRQGTLQHTLVCRALIRHQLTFFFFLLSRVMLSIGVQGTSNQPRPW